MCLPDLMETLLLSSQTAQLRTRITSDKISHRKKLSWSSHKIHIHVCCKAVETN